MRLRIGLIIFIFLIGFSVYLLSSVNHHPKGQVAGKSITAAPVTVAVSIGGESRFTLFGFTSPGASVLLEGMSISEQTYANNSGYFEFKNRFSPLMPQEACLTARDQFGRLSPPTCLPPFLTNYNVRIGPVILPPTISLNNPASGGDYFVGDEVILSGQTIPNTDVNFSLFTKQGDLASAGWHERTVYAFYFPDLSTKSDEKGNYSLSIPSTNPNSFNVFTQANYQKSPSPKSITLNLQILPVWMIIIKIFLLLLLLIKPYIIEMIILFEAIFLIIFLSQRLFQPQAIARKRAIILRQKMEIVAFMVN